MSRKPFKPTKHYADRSGRGVDKKLPKPHKPPTKVQEAENVVKRRQYKGSVPRDVYLRAYREQQDKLLRAKGIQRKTVPYVAALPEEIGWLLTSAGPKGYQEIGVYPDVKAGRDAADKIAARPLKWTKPDIV